MDCLNGLVDGSMCGCWFQKKVQYKRVVPEQNIQREEEEVHD